MGRLKKVARIAEVKADIFDIWGNFDDGLVALKSVGAKLSPAKLLAFAETKGLPFDKFWIREGVIYTQDDKYPIILTRESLLDDPELAKLAVQAHYKKRHFIIKRKKILKYLDMAKTNDPQVFVVDIEDGLIIQNKEIGFSNPIREFSIPTKKFSTNPLTLWLFGEYAKLYGDFLTKKGIRKLKLWFDDKDYAKKQDGPYLSQLLLIPDGGDPIMICGSSSDWHLVKELTIVGVLEKKETIGQLQLVSNQYSRGLGIFLLFLGLIPFIITIIIISQAIVTLDSYIGRSGLIKGILAGVIGLISILSIIAGINNLINYKINYYILS